MSTYQIIDEPTPKWNHLVVQPLWPLFALMFAGSWLAFPWFIVNALAMGCPHRVKTIVVGCLFFVAQTMLFLFIAFIGQGDWDRFSLQYALLSMVMLKLGVGYYLYMLQSRSFELYEYFSGMVRNGLPIVFIGYFLAPRVMDSLPGYIAVVIR